MCRYYFTGYSRPEIHAFIFFLPFGSQHVPFHIQIAALHTERVLDLAFQIPPSYMEEYYTCYV